MDDIHFSDFEKERMIHQLLNGKNANGGHKMKKFSAKKLIITAVACMAFFSATAFAAGKIAAISSSNDIDSRTDNFENVSDLEKKAGLDINAVESFDNGYTFDHMEIEDMDTEDENGNIIGNYKGISINYKCPGKNDISISMDPSDMYDSSSDIKRATSSKDYNGIKLYYNKDEYLFLPPDEEPSAEELKRQEDDNHFFISYGSDQRTSQISSSVEFELNGVNYTLLGFDLDMSEDELYEMAQQIIDMK